MMGIQHNQHELFSYHVNLDKRVRPDHPLRQVSRAVDFSFVRARVASSYGHNGHESVDPVVLMKMMFLLFYDNVSSERELMNIIPERLDYLWFLGYGLDDPIPDHSVLSKARRRWGPEVFQQLFVQTIEQCVRAGLVGGDKLHVDASLIAANASKDSVIKSSPQLIAAYAQAYAAQEKKLSQVQDGPEEPGRNDTLISTTDPDCSLTRKGAGPSRPAYHHHRAVDDVCGVITAVTVTAGSIVEDKKLMAVVAQSQQNTGCTFTTVVADHKYGTVENYLACQAKGLVTHMGDCRGQPRQELFAEEQFRYDPNLDVYICPAAQQLTRKRFFPQGRWWEYHAKKSVCARCALRSQCTRSQAGRTLKRHEQAQALQQCRAQARSERAKADRKRRQHLMEGSFADAANNHGFKRARWRRQWRQQIQDYLIAAIQNIRILLARRMDQPVMSMAIGLKALRLVDLRRFSCPWTCLSPVSAGYPAHRF